MGNFFAKDEDDAPSGLVLVPPLFERDFRGRSRMTRSSYDWMFCKPGLKWLFSDYIRADLGHSILRFRPTEDPRLSVHARFAARATSGRGSTSGRMALRFQPQIDEPLTFLDIKTGTTSGSAVARACYFDTEAGFGSFAILPLVASAGSQSPDALVGLRYSSPEASIGCITQPLTQQLRQIWGVYRSGPFCFGVQLNPAVSLANGGPQTLDGFLEKTHRCASYAVSYSPDTSAGRSNFTTAVELRERSQLSVALLYHMAVQRMCKNPLEEDDVVGITNYIDLGLQVATNLEAGSSPASSSQGVQNVEQESHLRVGAAWQVNKNWLLKARLGNDSAAAAVVLKAWWQPSATFALSAIYDFARRLPRFGFTFNIENYGNIRYERSGERLRTGRALVQRHVALPEDLANKEGKGLLVQKKDLDNRKLLGQTAPASARYL